MFSFRRRSTDTGKIWEGPAWDSMTGGRAKKGRCKWPPFKRIKAQNIARTVLFPLAFGDCRYLRVLLNPQSLREDIMHLTITPYKVINNLCHFPIKISLHKMLYVHLSSNIYYLSKISCYPESSEAHFTHYIWSMRRRLTWKPNMHSFTIQVDIMKSAVSIWQHHCMAF